LTLSAERRTLNANKLALIGFVFHGPKTLKTAKILINLCYYETNAILSILTLALFFQIAVYKTCHQACHSALDAESSIVENSGFLLSQGMCLARE
jgi:hypothetical protein